MPVYIIVKLLSFSAVGDLCTKCTIAMPCAVVNQIVNITSLKKRLFILFQKAINLKFKQLSFQKAKEHTSEPKVYKFI